MKFIAIIYTIFSVIYLSNQNRIKTDKSSMSSTLQARIQKQNIVNLINKF